VYLGPQRLTSSDLFSFLCHVLIKNWVQVGPVLRDSAEQLTTELSSFPPPRQNPQI